MRVAGQSPPPPSSSPKQQPPPSLTAKDAESLFRTKSISEIRNVESATRKQIQQKSEELRQLVGNRYRDLIDSAESIHQWQIVESFKTQISQRSRDRLLLDQTLGLSISAYADALAAVSVIDDLNPSKVLRLFLDARRSCVSQKLGSCKVVSEDVIAVFCEVLKVIQVSVAQVGELFMQVLSDLPLFYKTVLGSPPASQLFGGIPNPDEEERLWKAFRDNLESVMVMLDHVSIANACSDWLRNCGEEIVNRVKGRFLIDAIDSGQQLAAAEKLVRETMDGKEVLEGSLEWLKSVFGSEIEMPWSRTRELVLGNAADLWDEIFEEVFTSRMKEIIDSGYDAMYHAVNVKDSVHTIMENPGDQVDFQTYLGGGDWFMQPTCKKISPVRNSKVTLDDSNFDSCLDAYLGDEVGRIRKSVDSHCHNVLMDLLRFLESPKASLRLKQLAPYLQRKCFESMSAILAELKSENHKGVAWCEMEHLYAALGHGDKEGDLAAPPAIVVQRSLFIGKLLFAFQKYSRHIPVILGSPRLWVNEILAADSGKTPPLLRHSQALVNFPHESTGKKMLDSSRRQAPLAASALFGLEDTILSHNLRNDDCLSATTPLKGWEQTVVKQVDSADSQSEMMILLPFMPSLYITSYLFQACEEIHRVGGHVVDKPILQIFAARLLEKVIDVYVDFLSIEEASATHVSEKGVLQMLLDLRFAADILAGGDLSGNGGISKMPKTKIAFTRKQEVQETKSVTRERLDGLVNRLSQKLDPIDWLTYEPYLWENEKQSYLRHAVLFGCFVQLQRMYTVTMQKLPTNSESNIMRCSTVPRFKYLPISAPVLSAKVTSKTSIPSSMDDVSSRNPWRSYTKEELSRNLDMGDGSSFGVAAPFLKSFMQVGSKFGESLKLGSMLTDGQVGRFGDILPAQAAGLLSSFTAGRSDH
ncbi:hypothetical protein L6452_24303 [Arctium lappa]|uniref:Uncharacterized protein n=1 Tax=Arctium lappa TaxID=4217 RepID=A0ACB9AA60_ARCLA|nr:hypothetical protein L6452_24303 [Arctium lappa]